MAVKRTIKTTKKKPVATKAKTGTVKKISKRDLIRKRQKELEDRAKNTGNNLYFFKEGTVRARIVRTPEDQEPGIEIVRFYLPKSGGVISPATLGLPCALMEKFDELKAGDSDDKDLSKKMGLGRRWGVPMYFFKDEKGKEVDTERGVKLALLTNGQYQEIIDYWLDEEELGDFADPNNGYDIKFKRVGKGMMDTEYTTTPCRPTRMKPEFSKNIYDPRELIQSELPTYEETQKLVDEWLMNPTDDGEDEAEETRPARKKKLVKKRRTKDL